MLDLDVTRVAATPKAAATVVLIRDSSGDAHTLEVCVMQRSLKSTFLGGAVVFPGGRLDVADAAGDLPLSSLAANSTWSDPESIALRVAACRELLEEVGILLADGTTQLEASSREVPRSLRELRDVFSESGGMLAIDRLHPLSRWVTPEAEQRRYDTRFFLARAPMGAIALPDNHEAVRAGFQSPSALLAQHLSGEITLFPPTHRTLQLLIGLKVDEALAMADRSCLDPICPVFAILDGTATLALPGDPLHPISETRIPGPTRYCLRGNLWLDS